MPNGFLFNLYKRTATSDTITYYFGSVFPNVLNVTNTKLIYTVAGADTETAKAGFDSVPLTADKIPLTGSDKTPVTTALKYRSNPNLLDNWYFGNPVNQRGQTEYTKSLYTMDRWIFDNNSGAVTANLTQEGVSFSASSGATGIASLRQIIDPESINALAGKTVTLSCLGKTDTSQQVLFFVDNEVTANASSAPIDGVCMTTCTYTFPTVMSSLAVFIYARSTSGAGEGSILAAKLELGGAQTLAHKEGDKWILNEIPDYGEQLRRCQRYFLKIGDASRYCSLGTGVARDEQFVSFTFPIPVTMRTVPGLTAVPVGFTMRHSDTKLSGGASFSVDAASQNSIMLKVQSQVSLTAGEAWEAFLAPNGSIMLSADL